uniref:Uncharacterized protein n=1 Tax=Eutreptiella gymnastica TaxID=73025 RepID=A0A7S4FSB6_9EUGL|mmetsp:Transcript_12583/g.22866  ORF Transcript_12583/g.22866 Transcript_12583/m.22866 type:complete len:100 (-) Transcript_12583:132-431(-)
MVTPNDVEAVAPDFLWSIHCGFCVDIALNKRHKPIWLLICCLLTLGSLLPTGMLVAGTMKAGGHELLQEGAFLVLSLLGGGVGLLTYMPSCAQVLAPVH